MVFEWRLPASLPGQLILSPELSSQDAYILNLFLATYYSRSFLCALFFVLFSSHGFSCAFLPVEMGCPYCTSQCLRFRSLSPIFTFSNDHLLGARFREPTFCACTMKASSGKPQLFLRTGFGRRTCFFPIISIHDACSICLPVSSYPSAHDA